MITEQLDRILLRYVFEKYMTGYYFIDGGFFALCFLQMKVVKLYMP